MFLSILGLALSTRKASPYDLNDFLFSAEELQRKYERQSSQSEHPHFSRTRWLDEVNFNNCELGYWLWVFEQVQADDDTWLLRH
ncbi:hypothetical protein [Pseudomonas oryzae]|uniref:Uncharacterized protein n=1 Tax=Pseudomonas oryzae TaxID=1392877 RepID=A0A1H1PT99_9PSED|nr:hypothetical protein [Pseudomonas oryzae]SDS14346.1 hypothetical protein SAMN05216221_1166 [Pseudomonas oryzae]